MLALAVGFTLVVGSAGCLAALTRPRGTVELLLAWALIGSAEVVLLSFLVSFVDRYERSWLLAAHLAVALASCLAVAIVRPGWRPRGLRRPLGELLGDPLLVVLALVVAAELGYLTALAIFTPPTEYDVLTYHLVRAVFWIQRASVGFVPDATYGPIDEYPPNAEILQSWTMLLSGSVRWVGLVQLGALVVTLIAIYGIAGRIGLSRRSSCFGALLFATLTVVALQAPTALNDTVVAALVVTAAFFGLGRRRSEFALAGLAVALLVGTKVTAALALPMLLVIGLLAHHGRARIELVASGTVGLLLGATWYAATALRDDDTLGTGGHDIAAVVDPVEYLARGSRYLVQAVELPGGSGRDRYLYVVAGLLVATAGILLRRPLAGLVAGALTALTVLALPLERLLHSVYFNGWQLVGYDHVTEYGVIRDPTIASNLQSWYGPLGFVLCLAALVVVARAVRRKRLPLLALALAASPLAFVAGMSIVTEYHPLNGRFAMGGVALAAATWGVVRRSPVGAAAAVAVAATTVVLSLVAFTERPAGVGLLEASRRPSVWQLPRGWSQSNQPEIAQMIEHLAAAAADGTTIAVTRNPDIYPFAFVGYPSLDHRLAYADTLAEAAARKADWAVLPLRGGCVPGWRVDLESPPWGVYRRARGVRCDARVVTRSG